MTYVPHVWNAAIPAEALISEARMNNIEQGIANSAPSGIMLMWPGATAPGGWLLCDGSAVSRATYAAIFAICGTLYGVGNGTTTFNLPDMRQRFPLGKAASGTGSTLAETGGQIDHVHTGPSHTHSNPTTASGGSHSHTTGNSGTGLQYAEGSGPFPANNHTHTVSTVSAHTHTQGNTGSAGTGNTGTKNPPFIALNFIIKT